LEGFVDSFMEQILSHHQDKLHSNWNDQINDFFMILQDKKARINSRLEKVSSTVSDRSIDFHKIDLSVLSKGIDFSRVLSNGFNLVTTIGSMALTGAMFGIGAIIGAILGAILYVIKALFGGESREAKLKRELKPELDNVLSNLLTNFNDAQEKLLEKIENQTQKEHSILENSLKDLKQLKNILIEKTINVKNLIEKYKKDQKQLQHNINLPILN